VLAGILLLAGVGLLTHRRSGALTGEGKVKYIHVITTNSSCDSIQAVAAARRGASNDTSASLPASAAALLQHILPLTNFLELRSAQLLDAATAAGVPVQEMQPLMQLHQHLWCR
jgi:hypothetical protein